MEVSSESTDDDEAEEDDTTLSISDPEEEEEDEEEDVDGAKARVASCQFLDVQDRSGRRPRGAREASPVFYIDPDDWAGNDGGKEEEERQDETLTAESAKEDQNTKEASASGAICTRHV